VATESKVDLFDAKNYDIALPEGASKQEQLDALAKAIGNCQLCPLYQGRTHMVFGVGNPDAELMFVGEAPGHDEDIQGEPFVGRAGQLLNRIIEAMGLKRSDVYIANVVKSRPPNNRAPLPEEMEACRPFLLRQIDIVKPKVICLLGAVAVRGLLQSKESITRIRGQFLRWRGILVMPTFHPAYLLRNPNEKRTVWEDMQKVRDVLRGKLVV
jgi:DNA polymerase